MCQRIFSSCSWLLQLFEENVEEAPFSIHDTLEHRVVHLTFTVYNHPVSFANIYELHHVIFALSNFTVIQCFVPRPSVDEYLIRGKQDSCCQRRNWPLGRFSAGSPPRNSSKNDPPLAFGGSTRISHDSFSFKSRYVGPRF